MADAFKVGILNDMSAEPTDQGHIEKWLRMCAGDVIATGRIDRPVEFVNSWGLGLPSGTAAAVERAFVELVEQDVLMIVGPAIGDDALVATPLADRYRVPTLNWAGAERGRSEYMFHLQVGSHEDESIILARHLASLGVKRVGVVHDRSPIGRKHQAFLQSEADIIGLRLAAISSISPLAEDATEEVGGLLDIGIDALVYMGLGLSSPAVARAATARGFTGPRAMNTAGIRGNIPEFGQALDGWTYIDMFSDHNRTLGGFLKRVGGAAWGGGFQEAVGYDYGRLVAEALARAPERTRDGVKDGLEQIKWLPAAEGMEGTLLGFGVWDRGALHGRYLVLRQWRGGKSVEIEQPV